MLARKSRALLALHRLDEATAAARAGLAGIPVTDESLRGDRFDATLLIGQVAEAALDCASAACSMPSWGTGSPTRA